MRSLSNKAVFWLFCMLLKACSTSVIRIEKNSAGPSRIYVTPDRVIVECEKVTLDDASVGGGFMLNVLDERKSVFTVVQGNVLDYENCKKRAAIAQKILDRGAMQTIGVSGDIAYDPASRTPRQYSFPRHGTFLGNGGAVQFMYILNEQGDCYDAYSGSEKPCPRL